MGRLTYIIESPAPAPSAVTPVNLAFAAAAVARASWGANKDRESIWDLEPFAEASVHGGAINDFATLLRSSTSYSGAGVAAVPAPAPAPRISRGNTIVVPFAPEVVGVHDVPRNSVLFRAHADEKPMASSLPPAEALAPSANEVASILQDRRVRSNMTLPEDGQFTLRHKPQRSQSFTHGLDADPGGSDDGWIGKGSYGVLHLAGGLARPVGVLSASEVASDGLLTMDEGDEIDDSDVFPERGGDACGVFPERGGDGERDGCLVLPVLRTLLAMQEDSPRPGRPGGPASPVPCPGAHHGIGHGASTSSGASTAVSRQVSSHALRASSSFAHSSTLLRQATVAFATNGIASPGGGAALVRQPSMLSPARRRVGLPAEANRLTRQPGSRLPPPMDDEGRQSMEMEFVGRTQSYSVSNMSPTTAVSRTVAKSAVRVTSTGLVGTNTGGGLFSPTPPSIAPLPPPAASAATSPSGSSQVQVLSPNGRQQGQGSNRAAAKPQPQPPSKDKSKDLFSWTHKLGKGKWLWSGGSTGGNSAEAVSPVVSVSDGPSVHGGGGTTMRSSQSGGAAAPQQQLQGYAAGRDPAMQLPPIDVTSVRRRPGPGSGAYAPVEAQSPAGSPVARGVAVAASGPVKRC